MPSHEPSRTRASWLLILAATACDSGDHERGRTPVSHFELCSTCGKRGESSCALENAVSCLATLATYPGSTPLSISVAWSPIDDFVLSGADGELRLLELEGQPPVFRERFVYREQGGRTAVAWSPDGNYALSASTDVRLFAVNRGTRSLEVIAPPFADNAGDLYALAFSPDGGFALSVGEDGVTRLLRVDPANGVLTGAASYRVALGKTYDVTWSPRGDRAAIANEDETLVVLAVDTATPSLTELERIHEDGWVTAVAWSPLGEALLSGTWLPCNSVVLWSGVDDGAPVETSIFHGHPSGVRVLGFDRAGDRAVTAGHDDTLRLFDFAGAERRFEHVTTWDENALGVHSVSFSRDGSRLLVAASHADRLTLLDASACRR